MNVVKKLKSNINQVRRNLHQQKVIRNQIHASPDFMIIGAMKCGTTSLFQYLGQHPEIIPPQEKELAYFTWRNSKGLDWYLNNFPTKEEKRGKLTFDATPAYIYKEKVAPSVARLFPSLKAILLLRDPVERAYSHWQFYHESKFIKTRPHLKERKSFEEAIKYELSNPDNIKWPFLYLDRGKYAQQIANWYQYFPKNQLLILESSELKSNLIKTLGGITDFLNISNYFEEFKKGNQRIEGFRTTVGETIDKRLNSYNINKYKQKMNPKTETYLRTYYEPYDKDLKMLTNKKFSWMK